MIRLSKNQIKNLHTKLIQETGGLDGIRDEGLLDSAISTPFQSFGNEELYPSIQHKAARLCFGLIKNHIKNVLGISVETNITLYATNERTIRRYKNISILKVIKML